MTAATGLQQMHDIVMPGPPPWWPPAPGVYALGLTLLLLLAWGGWLGFLHWRRNRYRRSALAELTRLEQDLTTGSDPALLSQLPVLLKRTALAAYGRKRVAALSGQPWLAFLDQSAGRPLFNHPAGQLLLRCDYGPPSELAKLDAETLRPLLGAIRIWITTHRRSAE